MSRPQYKESMPFVKLFVADFIMDTQGLPLSHIGAYIRLMVLYWSAQNTLPDDEPTLFRKAGAITDEDKTAVVDVLATMFPRDYEGLRRHYGLDKQLDDSREVNARRSSSMKASHQARRGTAPAIREPDNEDDF